MRAFFLFAALALLAACPARDGEPDDDGSDGADGDGVPAADADPFAPDADPLAPDAAPGAPDAAPGPSIMGCVETCAAPADCAPAATSPLTDADNYACEGQRCRYVGCNSTSECTQTYMSPDYVCGTVTGNPLPACYAKCNAPADCVLASPIYSEDNWACDGGKCRWTGCTSDQECRDTFMNPEYTCAPSGAGFDTCFPTCDTPADCAAASPIFGADNYACTSGRCVWQGCNDSAECMDANGASWVCE